MQTGRLTVLPDLPDAKTLERELLAFRSKINISTGRESFEAWRERDHDDLDLGVAMACWVGNRPSGKAHWGPDPFALNDWRG